MQDGSGDRFVQLGPAGTVSRRTIVSSAARFVAAAALAVMAGAGLTHVAVAQDEEIILTAAASEVGARPGSAYAQGAAASAAADQDAGATAAGAGNIASAPAGGGTSQAEGVEAVPSGRRGSGGGGHG